MRLPYYEGHGVQLFHGDCREVMKNLPDNSVHSIVTDPPYELTSGCSTGFMGHKWDGSGVAFQPAMWAEAMRVLKPGGYLLAAGGTRTWHRLACAIEDAGFEIRDSIAWMYGNGFPKSLDVSKAIDREAGAERQIATPAAQQWAGYGTALKPAHEPMVLARKPLCERTVAANVLRHGTGALNIDATRIGTESTQRTNGAEMGYHGGNLADVYSTGSAAGRWPANVVLSEDQAEELDRQSGDRKDGVAVRHRGVKAGMYGPAKAVGTEDLGYGGGGASRFFYVPKADSNERLTLPDGLQHSTVKPLTLMRYLVRLVTPPGGTVLEPFSGSGTTVEAAVLEGFRCVAIEIGAEYLPFTVQRINRRRDPMAYLAAQEEDLGLFCDPDAPQPTKGSP